MKAAQSMWKSPLRIRSWKASGLRLSGLGLTEAACAGGWGMSDTDLARSWWVGPLGGDDASGKEGRAPVTELSARDLSCSDQLKPCWSARGGILLEEALWCLVLLACGIGIEFGGMAVLARRQAPERAVATAGPCACEDLRTLGLCPTDNGEEVGLLPLPGLPPGR